jgi:predicted RND superfamily exporter protein
MSSLPLLLIRVYDKYILERPRLILICLLLAIVFLAYQTKNFKLDASPQTLILETDQDLKYSQLIQSRYGGHEYLLITYTPTGDLFSDHFLKQLTRLRDDLKNLTNVASVTSILDAPLLESPPLPVRELGTRIRTLASPDADRVLAQREFAESPLYRDLLISPDLKTTALQIAFHPNERLRDLEARRERLREKQTHGRLSAAEARELVSIGSMLQQLEDKIKLMRHRDIAAIREIMAHHRGDAELFLGGISMITDDLISFIKNDLKIFGIGVLFFLIVALGVIFRSKRWVILPILCCAASAIAMIGLLGMFGWRVTVISSNFISLQLIITMAITIHLIVRYRYLAFHHPGAPQRRLILDTVRQMMTPCWFAALTTIAGFGSLLFCDILPVKTFGWMMIAGILTSLFLTFLIFPAGLMLMEKKIVPAAGTSRFQLTSLMARFTEAYGKLILIIGSLIVILSIAGISRLGVENSFIDYFRETTEIHQGMKIIDQKLGGTTPLDVIVETEVTEVSNSPGTAEPDDGEFAEFDEFEEKSDNGRYWFTVEKMAMVSKIHDYLDKLPETGKVLSLATMLKIVEKLNDGTPLDNFQLALLYSELPEQFKGIVLTPYVSVEHNQLRFAIRVKDSEKSLKRNLLINRIRRDLSEKLGLKEDQFQLTGLLVLYNNMLQSLFKSQILTLGIVVLALAGMFLLLFRSLKIAMIALVPNLLAVGTVLGFMGWLNIPLDMMTITIAAISMGIAVDNSIHYIYRYKKEFETNQHYIKTLHLCHSSIGRAMYYTSITIIIGFSILVLSNFLPSIYFGLLTGMAMLIALLASLTLLPQLLILFRPFGPEGGNQGV